MPWIVEFYATGEHFKPDEINYAFTRLTNAGTIQREGHYRNKPVPYGSITIEVPKHVPNRERIAYIVKVAQALLPELIQAGATEWHINIGRFYSAQCNEAYTSEELSLIASLNCPLHYSAYKVNKKEEIELEEEYGGFDTA